MNDHFCGSAVLTGAIFDMDGTLLDSMYIWEDIGSKYLKSRGITPEEGHDLKVRPMSIVEIGELYIRDYGFTETVQEIIDGINALVENYYYNIVQPKPGVPEFLEKLQSRGVVMCVATATDRYMVEAALDRCGLAKYFKAIFTCTEAGAGKDKPDIYEQALSCLGTEKRSTAVFEDAPYAMRTAKKAGFPVVGIWDRAFKDQREKCVSRSHVYADTYAELTEKLEDPNSPVKI